LAEPSEAPEAQGEDGQNRLRFDQFAAYGFSVEYPADCRIEMKPRVSREEGEVAFKFPGGNAYFLTWGPLAKVEKFQGAEGHANYSIERVKKSRDAKINKLERESLDVNGHASPFNRVSLDVVRKGLLFGSSRRAYEIRSLHVHCDKSGRYFLIYVQGDAESSQQQEAVMGRIVQTFKCHRE
jgi:hypothetical protein